MRPYKTKVSEKVRQGKYKALAKNQCYHGDMESMTSNEFKLLLKLIVKLLKEGKT